MSAKKQNAPRSLDNLDPQTRAALQEAARQSGMTLEAWLAAAAGSAARAPEPQRVVRSEAAGEKAASRLEKRKELLKPAFPEEPKRPRRGRPPLLAKAEPAPAALPTAEVEAPAPSAPAAEAAPKPVARRAPRPKAPHSEPALTAASAIEIETTPALPAFVEPRALSAAEMALRQAEATEAAMVVWAEPELDTREALPEAAPAMAEAPVEALDFAEPDAAPTLPAAPPLDDLVSRMALRLEEIERKVEGGPAAGSALEAIGRLEARVAELGEPSAESGTGREIESLLAGFEDRLGHIAERIARSAPRPIGRRGSDPREEVLSAVTEIRSRQRDLEADSIPFYPARFRPAARPEPEPAIAGMQSEIGRLREAIGELATRGEVGAIECSLRDLSHQLSGARGPGDLQAMTGPIQSLQAEIRGLADVVANGVHGKLASDLERLVRRIDVVAGSGADPAGVTALINQLSDAQHALMEMAEPRRVQSLVDQVSELNAQLAEIRSRQVDAYEFASLKSAVEEIRVTLKTRFASAPAIDFTPHFEKLARKLDALGQQTSSTKLDALSDQLATMAGRLEQGGPDRVVSRLDELSRKIDSFGQGPERAFVRELEKLSNRIDGALSGTGSTLGLDRVLTKLDRLDENLRRRPAASELKPLEELVRSLAEKFDHAGQSAAGAAALDTLEKQILGLAHRLERSSGRDLSLLPLKETMGDLMNQVETLREGASPAGTARGSGKESEFELLKRELAEIDARSAAERFDPKPDALQNTLEKVVSRLTTLEQDAQDAPAPVSARQGEVLRAPALPADENASRPFDPVQAGAGPLAEEADRPLPPSGEEILLEPGAGPPRASLPATVKSDNAADIKASFIAAARRAAQAAAAEAAAGKAKHGRPSDDIVLANAGTPATLSARVRTAIDKRRRPLLLGLAAVVLAVGAVQVIGPLVDEPRSDSQATAALTVDPAATAAVRDSSDPTTTQSIAGAAPAPETARLEAGQERASDAGAAKDGRAGPPAGPLGRADAKLEARSEPKSEPRIEPKSDAKAAEPALAPAPRGPAPAQVLAAVPQASSIGPAEPAPGPIDRIANVASAGEIPIVGVPAPLRQAALAGDPVAVYELATRLAEGRGAPRDPKLAAKLFERAALHGLAPAQYRIGNHYEKGVGVGRDLTLAKLWYQRAAEKGNARAMHNLGVLLADGSTGKPDYAGAAGWFRRAAEHGIRDSQFNLGVLLARGLGGPQDLAQSYTWFSVAAAQGDTDSAKKREEVATRMGPHEMAAARAAAERWRAETPDKAANEIAPAPSSWTEAPAKRGPISGKV